AERHVGEPERPGHERRVVVDRAVRRPQPHLARPAVAEEVAIVVGLGPEAVRDERAGGDVAAVRTAVVGDRVRVAGGGRARRVVALPALPLVDGPAVVGAALALVDLFAGALPDVVDEEAVAALVSV